MPSGVKPVTFTALVVAGTTADPSGGPMRRVLLAAIAAVLLSGCQLILVPGDGAIVAPGTMTVSGEIPNRMVIGGTLRVNGVVTPVAADRTWSTEIETGPAGEVTVVEAVYTEPGGKVHRQQSAVVAGPRLAPGERSADGVGMAFTSAGLDNLGPVINDLAGGAFDISALILAQDPLIPPTDAGLGVTITGKAYEAGSAGVAIDAGSSASGVTTRITVEDLYLGLDVRLSGLISGPCKLEIQIPSTTIDATFDLRPDAANPSLVDVNQVAAPVVTTAGVSYEFISGVCDPSSPIIGSIVTSAAGAKIEGTVKDGFASQLGDPDGAGPVDSAIAAAIQTALAEISIAGSVGDAVEAHLDAPFTEITESAAGIDLRADADFFATKGTGPGDCPAPASAPNLPNTYDTPGAYPTLGGTTPGGLPYGLGLVISSSAFNQLLGAMTECGLLNQDIHEIALAGGTPTPITSSVLSLLVPSFGTALPAGTPMLVRLDPQFSPFLSGDPGPAGEQAELQLADLRISFVEPKAAGDVTWLTLAVDAPLGFELAFDDAAGALAPTITPPPTTAVDARVLDNKVGADEAAIETLFPNLFPSFVGGLSDSFGAFPLPDFLGLDLGVIEVARQGNSYVLYANLEPAPQTHLENVAVTDLSSADRANDSCCFDSGEWRHRTRKKVTGRSVQVDLDAMIGADACCTVDDQRENAHAGGRITFDVVPADGETWKVDLSHVIAGAHTLVGEGVGGGYGAQSKISPVTGRYRVGDGAWTSFDFAPSLLTSGWRNSHFDAGFTGGAATAFTGTTRETVTVEFGFDVEAFSDSNLVFPAEAGNEAAVRLGANDSLTNGFTAGDYPGPGNRDIAADGYRATILLSTVG